MPELLNDQVKKQVQDVFKELQNAVQIVFFRREDNCDYCNDTQQLLEEVAALSDKIAVTVYDLQVNTIEAKQYNIDKAPGFTITARIADGLVDFGIRYYGIPSGHEFTSLINDIVMVSSRNAQLDPATVEFLKTLNQPIHLQVFTTPT